MVPVFRASDFDLSTATDVHGNSVQLLASSPVFACLATLPMGFS